MVDSPSSLPGVVATARWCPEDTQDRDFCKRGQKSEGICLRSGPSSCGKSVLVFAIFLRDGAVPAILVSDGPAPIIVISHPVNKLSTNVDPRSNHLILKVMMPNEIALL